MGLIIFSSSKLKDKGDALVELSHGLGMAFWEWLSEGFQRAQPMNLTGRAEFPFQEPQGTLVDPH